MISSSSSLRFLGRLLLAVMLFAQFAMAAQACVTPRHGPAAASGEGVLHSHCPHMAAMAADEVPMSANLCAAQASDQSADVPSVTIHALPALAVLEVVLIPPALPALQAAYQHGRLVSGDPPIPFLFQVFRS